MVVGCGWVVGGRSEMKQTRCVEVGCGSEDKVRWVRLGVFRKSEEKKSKGKVRG